MISSIDNVLVRAAASSIASGRPSSDRHRSCTASSGLARRARSVRCAPARRVNNATASDSASGASSNTTSPSTSSGTWLVHRIRSPGAASRRRTASAAAASMTCSQLSRMTNAGLLLSRSNSAASPPTFNAATNVSTTSSAVAAVSSRANQTPPGPTPSDALSARPVAIATAVFPTPPGPTISTSRSCASRSDTAATSASRPTSSADIDGRFPARRVRARALGPPSRATPSDGVVDQDLLLELLQLQSRVEAELVGQPVPDPLVRRQRVGLAAVAVQGDHQQRPQALAQRMQRARALRARRSRRRRRRDRAARRAGPRRDRGGPPRGGRGAG